MNTTGRPELFTNVDASEQAHIEGGVLTVEYLILGTFLALALIVGIPNAARSGGAPAVAPTRR
jgi:hypothetical protein